MDWMDGNLQVGVCIEHLTVLIKYKDDNKYKDKLKDKDSFTLECRKYFGLKTRRWVATSVRRIKTTNEFLDEHTIRFLGPPIFVQVFSQEKVPNSIQMGNKML